MINQKEVSKFATELRKWLNDLLETEDQERLAVFRSVVVESLEKNGIRKTSELMVFSNKVLALLYPKFEAFLLGSIPASVQFEAESELSLPDAGTVLLRDLCRAIESFETCEATKSAINVILSSTVSPIRAPKMPFNDADPYMEIDD